MPRIGLITGEYPPMEGGVGAFTQELAQALAANGHEIHILTSREARPATAVHHPSALRQPTQLDFAQLYPFIHKWRWPSLTAVAEWVMRYNLDVVNIQYQAAAYNMRSPAINFLPWRLRGLVKTVVTFHDLRVPYLFPKAGRLRQTAVHFMARQAHGVIVTNQADYQALTSNLQTPVRQIPIGSNIATHTPSAAEVTAVRQSLHLQAGDFLLGYFGFLNESKGADTLIDALAQMDTAVHLVFIGGQTGSSDPTNQAFLAQLQSQIARLGLTGRVHWSGFLPDPQVSAYLHAADLMAMPYRDGVSLRRGTLMAVLAHGRPLVTTYPTVPVPELKHGETMWLVPPDDAFELAEAVRALQANAELRQALGSGAAQVADQFSWERIAEQTADWLLQDFGN
ncbi:MAG: glycosyltransferase family 4 protein [Ardenticatenaceae bacterium]|nr:glycosyltransferase family 4 protein [Ardenticatenaceae bacterium]MCB9005331.1 glycosyltransferase family 4 protein [Ardenticatenaceae bacterium]